MSESRSLTQILLDAKAATVSLQMLSTAEKNRALEAMASALEESAEPILRANAADLEQAAERISPVMQDRLRLNAERIAGMVRGIRDTVALPDPVGEVIESKKRPNGLTIDKVRVPFGVVAMIYESRPNVTSDAAALCLKSGNVCVLRGGKEAFQTSQAIVEVLREGLRRAGFSPDYLNMVPDISRQGAQTLMEASGLVDLLIPRGGAGLIAACLRDAKVPCIQTGTGICHIYVDSSADSEMALSIIENAKTSRPSVCNAAEVCLVARDIAADFLPRLHKRLTTDRTVRGLAAVELRPDAEAAALMHLPQNAEADFDTEFLDYVMAIGVVEDVQGAIRHIAAHSTHHSEAIVTNSRENAELFTAAVDSAAVYVNASTRFTDGGEFGLGCEIGISTQKLHARGPMGLCEMTTYKYVVHGNGQIR